MQRKIWTLCASIFLCVAVLCLAGRTASALTFDLDLSGGWIGQMDDGQNQHGFYFVVAPGLSFADGVFGLFLDQGLGGLYYTGDNPFVVDDDRFIGHTIASFHFLIPGCYTDSFHLPLNIGIGGLYEASHNHGADWHDSAFAFKVGLAGQYFLHSDKSIALTMGFDYILAAWGNSHNDHFLSIRFGVVFKLLGETGKCLSCAPD